jgi:hypothetical protein
MELWLDSSSRSSLLQCYFWFKSAGHLAQIQTNSFWAAIFRLFRYSKLIQEAFGYAFVGFDAAIAQEGPVLASDFDEFGV